MKYREFNSKIDRLLKRVPALGKILTSLFGTQEFLMLEAFRYIDKRFNTNIFYLLDNYLIKGRWGGKVIPLEANIDLDSRFLPSQEILKLLSRSNVTGISWCYCRKTQREHGKPNCDHPLNTCIHIGMGKALQEIPYKSENLKKVSKEEIRELLEECDRRGLIHQLIYYPSPQFYYVVCNCCPCCCVVLNRYLKLGSPQMIKSDFIAETNMEDCTKCGACEEWCYFGARKINEQNLVFNPNQCFGCGICVSKCPNNAIILKRRN